MKCSFLQFLLIIFLFQGNATFAESKIFTIPGDFKVNDMRGKAAVVYADKDKSAQYVGFIPVDSYIKEKENIENEDWKKVEYYYVSLSTPCAPFFQDAQLVSEFSAQFNSALKNNNLKSFDSKGKELVMKKVPEFCYKHDIGWVMTSKLERAGPLKTQAGCDDCDTGAKLKLSAADELKNTALKVLAKSDGSDSDIIDSPEPLEDSCGPKGKPKIVKLKNVSLKMEMNFELKSVLTKYQRPNGTIGKKWKKKKEWHCEMNLESECEQKNINPNKYLESAVEIANFFQNSKNGVEGYCKDALDLYYDNCSPWKEMTYTDRFKKLANITSDVVKKLKIQKHDDYHAESISPELLTCVARRESHDLEPFRLNYTACGKRINPDSMSPAKAELTPRQMWKDWNMQGWVSDAGGLVQHRLFSLVDHWNRFLSQEKPLKSNGKTYEQVYGTALNLFKAMYQDPDLQMEIMARHINYLMQDGINKNRRNKKQVDAYTRAILKYDTDQSNTYVPNVKKCADCLKQTPGSQACIDGVHGAVRKKVKKNKGS